MKLRRIIERCIEAGEEYFERLKEFFSLYSDITYIDSIKFILSIHAMSVSSLFGQISYFYTVAQGMLHGKNIC